MVSQTFCSEFKTKKTSKRGHLKHCPETLAYYKFKCIQGEVLHVLATKKTQRQDQGHTIEAPGCKK